MLVREASIFAVKKVTGTDKDPEINMDDFNKAMSKVFPSVSRKDE